MADPLQSPALETPPGVISQFPTTHSGGQVWFRVSATLFTIVPGTLLLLRLYTKLRIVRKVDITDYITITSFLLFIALLVCVQICVTRGSGVHQWNLTMHDFIGVRYWLYICEIIYSPTIFLLKTALILQYLRLLAPNKSIDRFMWYSARILIVVEGLYYSIGVSVTIFSCSPREAIWNPMIQGSRCLDNNISSFMTCLFNIFSDIAIMIPPAKAIWRLSIPTRKKIWIVLLFAVGLLACIANILRIIYVSRIIKAKADMTYNVLWVGMWVFAEISFGFIVTCAFSLPKLIQTQGPKLQRKLCRLTPPLPSPSVEILTPSKKQIVVSQEVTLDEVIIGNHSLSTHDQNLETPSFSNGSAANYSNVTALHAFEQRCSYW